MATAQIINIIRLSVLFVWSLSVQDSRACSVMAVFVGIIGFALPVSLKKIACQYLDFILFQCIFLDWCNRYLTRSVPSSIREGSDIEWRCILTPKAPESRIRPKLNLILPYLMLKAPESRLLLRVLDWKTLIHCQPATSPSTHQLRYLGDLSSKNLCENNSRAALLVSNILFHLHALLANQDKKIERNLK